MPGIIRLSKNVTLRLNTQPDPPPSLRITIKPKKSRQALAGVTNSTKDEPLLSEPEDECKAPSEVSTLPGQTWSSPPQTPRVIRRLPRRYPPGPFYRLGLVGKGTFSEVIAVRDLRYQGGARGRVLCLKTYDKIRLKNARAERIIVQEIHAYQTLTAAAHNKWLPFVMRMDASMEDTTSIIFAMELMECDLLTVMADWEEDLINENKRKWIAEMVTGIAAIHSAGIIHRDVRPENILIDFAYNVRITDFGCSRVIHPNGRSLQPDTAYCRDVAGCLPYLSPEMIANKRLCRKDRTDYGIAIDYWGLGCAFYELETCLEVREVQGTIEPLFETIDVVDEYVNDANTLGAQHRYEWFEGFDDLSFDLISGLLCPSASQRFGHRELYRHPYFLNEDTGKSEFDGIEARGLALNTLPDKKNVSERILCMHDAGSPKPTFSPVAYVPRAAPIGYDLSNIGWINPKGIWGPLHNDRAFYANRPQ